MRRALMATSLAASLTLLAGCSDSDPEKTAKASAPSASSSAGSSASPSTDAEPAKPANPLEGLSARQVFAKSKAAFKDSESVHVVARLKDGKDRIVINLKLNDTGKAIGSLTINGSKIDIRRRGKTLYYQGDRKFWKDAAGNQAANLFVDKWLMTKQSAHEIDEFFDLTDLDFYRDESMKLNAAERRGLRLVKGINVAGQATVGLKDTVGPKDERGTLYVAAADPALPMKFATKDGQFLRFQDWGLTITVRAPKNPLDIAELMAAAA